MKIIDYVVVIPASVKETGKFQYIVKFIKFLEDQGVTLELKRGTIAENVYITLHLNEKCVPYYALKYDIDVSSPGHTSLPNSKVLDLPFFRTPVGDDLFKREGTTLTRKERILITHAILTEAKFGDYESDYGVEKLIRFDIAKTAYPLHTHEEDRELLLKYWANISMWYKEQPLNTIEKYFGSEVAFYFAWLGFYNKMLVLASLVGLFSSFVSLIHLNFVDESRVIDICESKLMMCPVGCRSGKYCYFKPLNHSCTYAKGSMAFDNRYTVFFAVFMSFWATLFINLWARFENTLKIRWNVEFQELDTQARVDHKDSCIHKRWSPLSGKLEPFVPLPWKITYIVISRVIYIVILIVIGLMVFTCIMFRVALHLVFRTSGNTTLSKHSEMLVPAISAWLIVIGIKIFAIFYRRLAEWLTNFDNPRTQSEYDRSVIQIRAVLAIFNNYSSLFYIAFLKGRFFVPFHPSSSTGYETDTCNPTGCMMSLCVQLCTMMLFQQLFGNILLLAAFFIKKKLSERKVGSRTVERWERDYYLEPIDRYFITSDFLEMVVQYGFVTFFVAAFPLGPFCALLNNCIELRLDAYKMLTRNRRPVPRQVSGIGTWNDILKMMTHLSIATNAFVLAFTTDYVVRVIYERSHGNLQGFIKSTLSEYDMADFKGEFHHNLNDNSTLCYYKSVRYPPNHPHEYELKPEFWFQTGMRLVCVIVFEHVVWVANGILAYAIPNVPVEVRQSLHHNRAKKLESKPLRN